MMYIGTPDMVINKSKNAPTYEVRWTKSFTKIEVKGNGIQFEFDPKQVLKDDELITDYVAQVLWKEHNVRGQFEIVLR